MNDSFASSDVVAVVGLVACIAVVAIALHGTEPGDRPAILRAIFGDDPLSE